MKRREFIKDLTLGSFLLSSSSGFLFSQKTPDLALIQGESPTQITKEAISALGGIQKFVSKGDQVLVKPNIGWDRRPEQAACTNPKVVQAIVELCLEGGAKKVKVMDHSINPAQRTYVRSGIKEAAKKAGAQVPYPNKHRLRKTAIHGAQLNEWEVYTDFLQADKLINVPIAKTHSLTRLTLGMKNWLGAIGGNRNLLHQNINQAMIDLSEFFKPALTVLDAYRILIRNGPQGGRLSDTKLHKTVVAGVDYVAVDAMGATFFNIEPSQLPFLQMAHKKGLGEIRLNRLNIEKRKV
ncbi:DUF362 domain-containing protein [bacterium]|nr:DUF362 domain-containing protein [bacterium]